MDRITHEVRLANWTKIIEQCNNRPKGMTVKQWLADNGINEKSYYYWLRRVRQNACAKIDMELPAIPENPRQLLQSPVTFAEIPIPNQSNGICDSFQADAVIRTGSMVIGISNSISDNLLSKLLEVSHYAR